jgi:hypothetical protein
MRTETKPVQRAMYVATQLDKSWLFDVQRKLYARSSNEPIHEWRKLWGLVSRVEVVGALAAVRRTCGEVLTLGVAMRAPWRSDRETIRAVVRAFRAGAPQTVAGPRASPSGPLVMVSGTGLEGRGPRRGSRGRRGETRGSPVETSGRPGAPRGPLVVKGGPPFHAVARCAEPRLRGHRSGTRGASGFPGSSEVTMSKRLLHFAQAMVCVATAIPTSGPPETSTAYPHASHRNGKR